MGNNIFRKVANINAKPTDKFIGPVTHGGISPPGAPESQVKRWQQVLPEACGGHQTAPSQDPRGAWAWRSGAGRLLSGQSG